MTRSTFHEALLRVADQLEASVSELNVLDAVAGDGDLGVTVAHALKITRQHIAAMAEAEWPELLSSLGEKLEREAPSTAGTLLAAALEAGSKAAHATEGQAVVRVAAGAEAAARMVGRLGGAEIGQRTLLDSLVPAASALRDAAEQGSSWREALAAAAVAADAGARSTSEMIPHFGRAAWTPERALGHEDAGARLVERLFAAIAASSS
jgi:dihydroxyacetone kinase